MEKWIYLADVSENLQGTLVMIGVILSLSWILYFLFVQPRYGRGEKSDSEMNRFIKYVKNASIITTIAISIAIFIPSKESIYLMLGASYLQTSKIPDKVSKIINNKLDEIIKDKK